MLFDTNILVAKGETNGASFLFLIASAQIVY